MHAAYRHCTAYLPPSCAALAPSPAPTCPPQLKVWNAGDWRCKLVTLCLTKRAAEEESAREAAKSSSTGSYASVMASSEEDVR